MTGPLVALLFTVTVYVPAMGGINGSPQMAQAMGLRIGHAACGPAYPKGTVFELEGFDVHGLKSVVECRDRGGMVGNRHLDLYGESWQQAQDVGKRQVWVHVYRSWAAYREVQHVDEWQWTQY